MARNCNKNINIQLASLTNDIDYGTLTASEYLKSGMLVDNCGNPRVKFLPDPCEPLTGEEDCQDNPLVTHIYGNLNVECNISADSVTANDFLGDGCSLKNTDDTKLLSVEYSEEDKTLTFIQQNTKICNGEEMPTEEIVLPVDQFMENTVIEEFAFGIVDDNEDLLSIRDSDDKIFTVDMSKYSNNDERYIAPGEYVPDSDGIIRLPYNVDTEETVEIDISGAMNGLGSADYDPCHGTLTLTPTIGEQTVLTGFPRNISIYGEIELSRAFNGHVYYQIENNVMMVVCDFALRSSDAVLGGTSRIGRLPVTLLDFQNGEHVGSHGYVRTWLTSMHGTSYERLGHVQITVSLDGTMWLRQWQMPEQIQESFTILIESIDSDVLDALCDSGNSGGDPGTDPGTNPKECADCIVYTEDSDNVIFTGDGTEENPLKAEFVGEFTFTWTDDLRDEILENLEIPVYYAGDGIIIDEDNYIHVDLDAYEVPRHKGYFSSLDELEDEYPEGEDGWVATIISKYTNDEDEDVEEVFVAIWEDGNWVLKSNAVGGGETPESIRDKYESLSNSLVKENTKDINILKNVVLNLSNTVTGHTTTINEHTTTINEILERLEEGEFVTKIHTEVSDTIEFTGSGTEDDPLIANYIGEFNIDPEILQKLEDIEIPRHKGVFSSMDDLEDEYPEGKDGWIATIIKKFIDEKTNEEKEEISQAVWEDGEWVIKLVTTGEVCNIESIRDEILEEVKELIPVYGAGDRITIDEDNLIHADKQTDNNFTDTYKNKIDSIEETVNDHTQSITYINETLNNHTQSITYINDTLVSYGLNLQGLNTRTSDHTTEINNIKNFIENLEIPVYKPGQRITIDPDYTIHAEKQTDNNFTNIYKNKIDEHSQFINNLKVPIPKPGNRITIDPDCTIHADKQTDNNFTNAYKSKIDNMPVYKQGWNITIDPDYTIHAHKQTENNFSNELKWKLENLEDPKYKGVFITEAALKAKHPTGQIGDSADVIVFVPDPSDSSKQIEELRRFIWNGTKWEDKGGSYYLPQFKDGEKTITVEAREQKDEIVFNPLLHYALIVDFCIVLGNWVKLVTVKMTQNRLFVIDVTGDDEIDFDFSKSADHKLLIRNNDRNLSAKVLFKMRYFNKI